MTQLIRRILIVDDRKENQLRYAGLVLGANRPDEPERAGPILPQVSVANSPEEASIALTAARQSGQPFHVLVTDLFMPDVPAGLSLIRSLRTLGFDPKELEVLLLSTHRDAQQYADEIAQVADAWGAGSAGLRCVFRERPASNAPEVGEVATDADLRDDEEFLSSLWTAIWEKIEASFRSDILVRERLLPEGLSDAPVFSRHPRTEVLVAQLLATVAPTGAQLLLEGESGTGKTHLARLVHDRSRRSKRPFEYVNCAAIPTEMFESEMYGHERGAFTGAVGKRLGYVRKANGGTLFLDEISELDLTHQAKLLGFLDDGAYSPVGGASERADVRVIAASNVRLKDAVSTGAFRNDLFYRLSLYPITLPPLRERVEDIVWLAQRFWGIAEGEGIDARSEAWTPEALDLLCQQPWRGNARELKHFVTRLKLMGLSGEVVSRSDLERLLDDPETNFVADSDLDTFNQRAQHEVFLRALARLPATASTPNVAMVAEAVMNGSDARLFPLSGSQRRAKVQAALYDHRKTCTICRRMISTQ